MNPELRAAVLTVPDPEVVYHAWAGRSPVIETDTAITLFRMADVLEVNRHPDVIGTGANGGSMGGTRPMIPLDLDGPLHTKWRKTLDPLFSARQVAKLEPRIRALTNELIDGFADRGRVELYSEFCDLMPTTIFLAFLGAPLERFDFFIDFRNDVLRRDAADFDDPVKEAERQARIKAAGGRMDDYLAELITERRAAEPRDDLLSGLLAATFDGRPVTDEDVVDIVHLLMVAGLDTVSSSLTCLVDWLARHPAARHALTAQPERWPRAIEELMRFHSPVPSASRTPTTDISVNGRTIPAGRQIQISWAAANLDPEVFPDPLTVDFDRTGNRHIAFASGFHRCLGSHLARLELRVGLEELHRRIPDYEIEPGAQPAYWNSGVRRVAPLPLVFPVAAEA
jgi:cytochrome P450